MDWFASGEIIVLGVTALVFLTYFIVWELGEKYPIVDLSLFKNRNFTIGVVATSLGFMVYMGTLTLLPLVLQSNLGYTATWAGLAAAPVGFLPIILSPIIGKFGNRVDMRLFVSASFLVFAYTFHWRTDFYAGMDMSNVGLAAVLAGFRRSHVLPAFDQYHLVSYERQPNCLGK